MEPAWPSRFVSFPIVLSIDLDTHLSQHVATYQPSQMPPSGTSTRVSYVVSRQIKLPKGFRTANQGLPDRRGSLITYYAEQYKNEKTY
jgi:hypothetical protein